MKLTPRFKTKYGEIVIFDECRFYTGFRMDMASRVMTASEIMVSAERFPDLTAVRAVVYLFENRDDFQYGYGYAADKFMIGSPFRKRWQSTDAFFADRSFWRGVDFRKVVTKEEILKVCAEVLQDGVWHDRENLLKELNERIPCLSASGIADSVIRDELRAYTNVALLEDQVGNWSVQLRQKAEPQVLVDVGKVSNESGDAKPNIFCSEKEAAFLKSFIDDVLRCGYDYKPQDIVRFHTSVKSGGFTLLGGAPGSGKSTLASLYSKALVGNLAKDQDDTRYLTVDVNPSWMDPNDVLGYWNLKEKYSCASSGLVPFLRKAAKCNEVRLVCMEEMNLARVEHYFSNFIQMMSRKPEDRILLGVPFDEKVEVGKDNARLLLPMNIRFVGTNNFDETTQRFSARFYDRCNYIELQQTGHFDEFPERIPSESSGEFNYGVSYEEYEKWWVKDARSAQLDANVIDKFKGIVTKLRALNLQPSPRVKLAILEYILSRPFFEGCGSEYSSQADCQLIALDEAIAQRVLPRYSINYLRDDAADRKELREELKDLPLSSLVFESKCNIGERPSRV
ncbi:MAG: AAA family ATPase [bacterium]|nr:AAA family ATPase [bacterium]